MKLIIEYLEKLGLSEIESKLYLILIESGPKRVRELAELAGLKRTTTYFYIDLLVDKGLVAEDVSNLGVRIAANPPERLEYLVEQKLKSAKVLSEQFPSVLKALDASASQVQTQEDTEIKYLKGHGNVLKVYNEALQGNEFRSFVKLQEPSSLAEDNVEYLSKALKQNKKLKIWEIIYDTPFSRGRAMKILAQNYEGYFCKFMPSNLKWSVNLEDILIYDGKVTIINYGEKVTSIVLRNPDFYNNQKELFDFIWRMLPE